MSDWNLPLIDALTRPLFTVGDVEMTLGTMVTALLYVAAVWWLASLVERLLLRLGRRSGTDSRGHSRLDLLSRIARYLIWIVGTLVALAQIGIDLSSLAVLGGAIGIGLGLGLQNIFSNFVAGIIILLERSLKVGDFVELESGLQGRVHEIAMRYTHVKTNDNLDVLVPNSAFINDRVTNWTHDDALRRMRVPFGIAYGVDKNDVLAAGVAAARRVDGVIVDAPREPTVWLVGYGDSAVDYELVVWAGRAATTSPRRVQAELMWALDDELQARDLEIPFPQRDLHLRSGTLNVRLKRVARDAEDDD